MEQVDPSLVNAPYIFPDAATLDRAYVFMELTPEQDEKYQREFQKAIGN
jgi:spermidine/putrescine transport system substrate-binding protein